MFFFCQNGAQKLMEDSSYDSSIVLIEHKNKSFFLTQNYRKFETITKSGEGYWNKTDFMTTTSKRENCQGNMQIRWVSNSLVRNVQISSKCCKILIKDGATNHDSAQKN